MSEIKSVKVGKIDVAFDPLENRFYYPGTGNTASPMHAKAAAKQLKIDVNAPTVLLKVGDIVRSVTGYTGEIKEVDLSKVLSYRVYWHKFGPEDNHPDNFETWESLNSQDMNHITVPVMGEWWPSATKDNSPVLVAGEGTEFETFKQQTVVTSEGVPYISQVKDNPEEEPEEEEVTLTRAQRQALRNPKAARAEKKYAGNVEKIKFALPKEGKIDEAELGKITRLNNGDVRMALAVLKKDGYIRYDTMADEFFVLTPDELLNMRPAAAQKAAGVKPTAAPRTPKVKGQPKPCACGCGELTSSPSSYFRMGHDARAKGILIKVLDGKIKDFTPTDRLVEYVNDHLDWFDRFGSIFQPKPSAAEEVKDEASE